MMDTIPNGSDRQGGDRPSTNQGGGKPRPYPVRSRFIPFLSSYRVGAGLAPTLVSATTRRFLCLLPVVFFMCAGVALLPAFSSQKALALGNTFIIAMLGDSQPPGFAPDLLSLHIYDTVVFVNAAAAPIAIAATDNSFSSPAIAPGKLWQVTFNSVGAFEYHESSPTPRAFGEIVVVPGAVALLPSPAPVAQETAIAYMQAGKTPPDTLWQQAVPPVQTAAAVSSRNKNQTTRTLSVPPLALLLPFVRPVILVITVLFALFAVGLGGLWLSRRTWAGKQGDEDDEDEDDE